LKLLKNTKSQKVAGLITCIYFQFGSLPLFLLYGVMCFLSNHPPLCQFASCCVDASYGFDFFCCRFSKIHFLLIAELFLLRTNQSLLILRF